MKPDLVETLERLLAAAPGADAFHLRLVDELGEGEAGGERLEEIFAELRGDYEEAVAQVRRAWGEPTWTGGVDRADFPDWSEALLLTFWQRKGALAYVALRHDDDHEPMFVEIGALTDDEVATLHYTKS